MKAREVKEKPSKHRRTRSQFTLPSSFDLPKLDMPKLRAPELRVPDLSGRKDDKEEKEKKKKKKGHRRSASEDWQRSGKIVLDTPPAGARSRETSPIRRTSPSFTVAFATGDTAFSSAPTSDKILAPKWEDVHVNFSIDLLQLRGLPSKLFDRQVLVTWKIGHNPLNSGSTHPLTVRAKLGATSGAEGGRYVATWPPFPGADTTKPAEVVLSCLMQRNKHAPHQFQDHGIMFSLKRLKESESVPDTPLKTPRAVKVNVAKGELNLAQYANDANDVVVDINLFSKEKRYCTLMLRVKVAGHKKSSVSTSGSHPHPKRSATPMRGTSALVARKPKAQVTFKHRQASDATPAMEVQDSVGVVIEHSSPRAAKPATVLEQVMACVKVGGFYASMADPAHKDLVEYVCQLDEDRAHAIQELTRLNASRPAALEDLKKQLSHATSAHAERERELGARFEEELSRAIRREMELVEEVEALKKRLRDAGLE